ncbi:hypothetical protein Ahy_B04g072141 [Arachis hypogaea]|uniref:Uncharacterized protein n=1 Tax=Arachis hypogaea TaxID=3818 RepID=A0A444ZMI5_ARAHY|nr:hypothetical protein Ahy_B04g072141 [Arachis hypogaea]
MVSILVGIGGRDGVERAVRLVPAAHTASHSGVEVSEPPESPSLYIDPGAETSASQQVEVEEEIEEPEEVPRQDAQFHTFKEVRFRAGSALAFTSAFIDFRGCNNWFNFWHHLGTVVATWNHVPRVERNVALPGLIRTFKMMGNYALTFVAIGGVYIGVKQLVQNARMKRDLVNGAKMLYGWSVNVSANTGTERSQYVNAGELSGSTSSHEGLNKLINIGVLALTLI